MGSSSSSSASTSSEDERSEQNSSDTLDRNFSGEAKAAKDRKMQIMNGQDEDEYLE
jgi:hypothetical protein